MDFSFMLSIIPRLLKATVLTLQISCISLILGLIFGMILGVIRTIGNPAAKSIINVFVAFCRGTPAAIQIYATFFLLPRFGIDLPIFAVGVIALTFNSVGYQVEIVRGALESIDKGQIEAATSIGMSKIKIMRYIIIPQSIKRMMAPLTNELANLIKASSVLLIISVYELTKAGYAIISASFKYAEVLIIVALIYFVIVQTLCKISSYLENNLFAYTKKTNKNISILN